MTPYGKKHLAAVAKSVAAKWGVYAKFPPAKVTDKWLKWRMRSDHHAILKEDLEYDKKYYPSRVKETERYNAQYIKKTEKIKPPAPYVSWQHIEDFHAKAKDGDFYNQLLNFEDMTPARRELCQLMAENLKDQQIIPVEN